MVLRVLGTFELSNATIAFLLVPKFYTLYFFGDLQLSVAETIRRQTSFKLSFNKRLLTLKSSRSQMKVVTQSSAVVGFSEPASPINSGTASPRTPRFTAGARYSDES